MNRKKYSVIPGLFCFCIIFSSCSKHNKSDSTIDVDFSEKSAVISETAALSSVTSEPKQSVTNSIETTKITAGSSVKENKETLTTTITAVSVNNVTSSPVSEISSNVYTTSEAESRGQDPVSATPMPHVSTIQSEPAEETDPLEKLNGKWKVDGKTDLPYYLIDECGGWLEYDKDDTLIATGTLETENGNDYSMFTSDKILHSEFSLTAEDSFTTSDGEDYSREYKNTND